jgi:lambda family phage tail tape measure protein
LKETQQTADQSYQLQIEDLRGIDDRVRTQDEHRHVQLEILDLVYEQKRMDLEYLQAQALRNGQLEEANRLQQQINHLPTEKASDADRVRRGTMGPLEAMADSVPKTAKEINEAFQSIEAQGLDGLSQAIAGVITGTENLKDAFGNLAKSIIADIIQMTVKMLIFRAISGLFGGGSSFGSASLINTASPLSGALSSAVPIAAGAGFRAAGGPVTAGQAYIVGERRPELFVPSTNGVIVPNVPRISIPSAANDRAPTTIVHQTFAPNFAGNSATREEVQQMGLMAKMGAIQAIRETQRRR